MEDRNPDPGMSDLWDKRYKEIEDEERARQARALQAEERQPTVPVTTGRRSLSDRPVLFSAVLGMCGAIGGVVIGFILSTTIGIIFYETLAGKKLPLDYGEGMGYACCFFSLFMIPVGGIPGAIAGALRAASGKQLHPIPPLIAGFCCGAILTLALIMVLTLRYF